MKTRIAINGFGRIGRNLFRLLLNHPTIEVVAINDIADNKTMAHLVKYDSIHGVLNQKVSFSDDSIIIDDKSFLFLFQVSSFFVSGFYLEFNSLFTNYLSLITKINEYVSPHGKTNAQRGHRRHG